MSKSLIVACDGEAASGKSTGAKLLSKKYKLLLLNSGLLYRYASKLLITKKPKKPIPYLRKIFKRISYNSIKKQSLHSQEISNHVGYLAKDKAVREIMRIYQKKIIKKNKRICVEGRDIASKILAKKPKYDFVSSLGYSMGYLGGGVLFIINILMYQNPHWFGIQDSTTAIRLSFVTVAVWWAVFSIPIFLFVPEPKNKDDIIFSNAVKLGWVQLKTTFSEIKQMRIIGLFLLSYWLYMDGVDTIIRMAGKLALSMGFEASDMLFVLILVQLIGFPAGLLFNWFSSIIIPKKSVLVAILFYTIATGSAYFMTSKIHFYALAGIIGLFQGGIQAISRSLFARLVPLGKEGEFFGFYNMLGKFSAVVGPILLGTVTLVTGNARMGLFALIVLFVGGGLLLTRVDFDEGERIAKEFSK